MSANWDGCSFKEEGPWASKKDKDKPIWPVIVILTIAVILSKFIGGG